MESILSSSLLPPTGIKSTPRLPPRRHLTVRCSSRYGWDHHAGGLVDESMIVLRKRIHEARMAERNYEPPAEWAEWEKQYYARYDADVLEAVRWIQGALMGTRPAVAVGVAALVAMSVPAAAVLAAVDLVEAVQRLIG